MVKYTRQLDEFRKLKPGWDSYGAVAVDDLTMRAVGVFLRAVCDGEAALVPLSDGSMQIEVHRDGFEIELEFETTIAIADGKSPMNGMRAVAGVWEPVNKTPRGHVDG